MADPTEIGKYKVVAKIGEGGMGKVYKAVHPTLKRDIIIKQLRMTRKRILTKRFLREASLMLDFRHENIVPVYDHFKERTSYYIVMEFVDGMSLEDLIEDRSQLSPMAAVLIFREICKGLKYAHDRGVIHRDIKPDNVLISKSGEIKLADFGIATSGEEVEELTKTGVVMGTPAYMSPEQIADSKKVDSQSDIYSMGVMLYQMVTGKRPFPGNFSGESIHKITKGIYVKPSKINPDVPRVLRRLVRKMMYHKKRRRYKDLQQVIDVLSKYAKRFADQPSVNTAVRRYLEGTELTFRGFTPFTGSSGRHLRSIIQWSLLGAAALALAGGILYRTGVWHEVFLAQKYGSMEVKVAVPPGFYKEPGRMYAAVEILSLDAPAAEGFLVEDSHGRTPGSRFYRLRPSLGPWSVWPIGPLVRFFSEAVDDPGQDGDGATELGVPILTTGTRYLPAGNYLIEARVETGAFVQAIYLVPRSVQRQDLESRKKREIVLPFSVPVSKPITVVHRIFDARTKESISRRTTVLMRDGNRWIDWDTYKANFRDYLDSKLVSGKEYRFRYSAVGYFEKEVVSRVEKDADELALNVGLIRKTGFVSITSDTEGLRILFDNKTREYTGGTTKEYVEFGRTVAGEKEFELAPGDYVLTIKKDSKHLANHQFSIRSDQQVSVTVSYESESKEISIR
jgi:eukaryotic-like serine/threonine-protein kinase